MANVFMQRLFLKNPLLHDVIPISLNTNRPEWRELTFGTLISNDSIGFPWIGKGLINPIAIELVFGVHAIEKVHSVLTFSINLPRALFLVPPPHDYFLQDRASS